MPGLTESITLDENTSDMNLFFKLTTQLRAENLPKFGEASL